MEEQESLRTYVLKGEYQKGLDELEKIQSYKKENSKLLYYLEKGIALHLQKKYKESLEAFEMAKEIHSALYTESITKNIQTLLVNDSSDNYSGETYERSLIHFYLSLNHLLLFQEDMEKNNWDRQGLFSTRAEILSWDSFLREQIDIKSGEAFFKNDLMAKIYGAQIHEIIGVKEDRQIALQLYKDAQILVFRNYNSYPSFNQNYQEFNKKFSKLPDIPEEEIRKKLVSETIFQTDLNDYLNYKILSLTKELRPKDLPTLLKKPELRKIKLDKVSSNVTIILERGIIPKKQAKQVYFPLGSYLYANPNDSLSHQINNYGVDNIFSYAQNNLGFKNIPSGHNFDSETGSYSRGQNFGELAISFEVPILSSMPLKEKLKLVIYDHNGNEIKKEKFLLISPVGEIAENALKEKEAARNLRIGLRLASKYLAVIVASYASYNALKKSTSPGMASFLAITQYYLSVKFIESLEKADLRYWSTLPQNIFLATTNLNPGEYRLNVLSEHIQSGEEVSQFLGRFKIDKFGSKKLVKFRISN
jgi:hypothetical protein